MNERSALVLGKQGLKQVSQARVMVVGCGGVGSFCIEALARTGIGHLIVIDKDIVEPSNINRQLIATLDTVGRAKVDLIQERIQSINPNCQVETIKAYYDADINEKVFSRSVDFVIDCIDSIHSKQDLIQACIKRKISFLCSMGMARRMDPTKLKIVEIEKTSYDPMAKILRQWKRKNNIRQNIMVVASTEVPLSHRLGQPLPSTIFVPASAGLILASECIRQIID